VQKARPAEGFHLFLQFEFLSLEFLESQGVRSRPSVLVLDFAFQGLVSDTEFTNTGFDGHEGASMLIALEVNTPARRVSDHKPVRGDYKALAPVAWAWRREAWA
jgi:hypothetical protein